MIDRAHLYKNFGDIKKIIRRNPNKKAKSGKTRAFFEKLSRGLMLPIAILPAAGLLLGIGGVIGANVQTDTGQIVASIFNAMSSVVFANLPLLFCIAIAITFTNNNGAAGFAALIAYAVFTASQAPFIQLDDAHNVISIMWFHDTDIIGIASYGANLGLTSMQTSIFGGALIGGLSSYIFNKVSLISVPTALSFFSGIRLVPIVLIPIAFLVALIMLIFWPWIGQAINIIGRSYADAPAGLDGLAYGILGRALMPFGLHYIPITLAFQTPFGGQIVKTDLLNQLQQLNVNQPTIDKIMTSFSEFTGNATIDGDQNIWNYINSIPLNDINGEPIFQFFDHKLGIYAGRFTQDYPTYLGTCMGIGAALIMCSEKENRKQTTAIIGSAMFVAFLTGITEPLEYSFLFIAPLLYYSFYVPISGLAYMLMEVSGAHVGSSFARGFIDLSLYGIVPVMKGTEFWWAFVYAVIFGASSFGVFYFSIKKFNLETPGRGTNTIKLMNKKQYQTSKKTGKYEDRILSIIKSLKGPDNIKNVTACATRLRVNVKSIENIKQSEFMEYGASGSIMKGESIQVIFGGEADIISSKINNYMDNKIDLSKAILNLNNSDEMNSKNKTLDEKPKIKRTSEVVVNSPVDGKIVLMENVPDESFAKEFLGKGIAIIPTKGNFKSLIKGKINMVFPTGHAYGFETEDGTKLLLHIGIDAVAVKDDDVKIFKPLVKINQKVDMSKNIADVNIKLLEKNAKSSITPIIALNESLDDRKIMLLKTEGCVKQGEPLFKIYSETKNKI